VILVNVGGSKEVPKTTAVELRAIRTAVAYLPRAPVLEIKLGYPGAYFTNTAYSSGDAIARLSVGHFTATVEQVNGALFGKFSASFWATRSTGDKPLTPPESAVAKMYSNRWLHIDAASDYYFSFKAFVHVHGSDLVRLLGPNDYTYKGPADGCHCTEFAAGTNTTIWLSDSAPWRIYLIKSGKHSWSVSYVHSRRLQVPSAAPSFRGAWNAIFNSPR
jgi:hypothetical protein